MADKFPTLQDAMIAALRECRNVVPENLECGVGVYKLPDGTFSHTDPGTGKDGSIDKMTFRIPKDATMVGIGHTHPKEEHLDLGDTSDGFSPNDVRFGKRTQYEMYLGSQKSGRITKLTPKSRKVTSGIVYGEDVDALYPDPELIADTLRKGK